MANPTGTIDQDPDMEQDPREDTARWIQTSKDNALQTQAAAQQAHDQQQHDADASPSVLANGKHGLFGFFANLKSWDFTQDVFNALANPPLEPNLPKPPGVDTKTAEEAKFENRAEQWKKSPQAPIHYSGPSDAPSAIAAAAVRHDIDANSLMTLSWIESRWNPNAVNRSSGAAGLFQFMPGTAHRFDADAREKFKGATEFDPFDVNQSAEYGAQLFAMNQKSLSAALGHDASGGEVYLAHQQGSGGAIALLQHRNENAADALVKYTSAYRGRRDLAVKAIEQNGGDANDTAGVFADMWIKRFDDASKQVAQLDLHSANDATVASAHKPNYRGMGMGPGPLPLDFDKIANALPSGIGNGVKQLASGFQNLFGHDA